MELCCGSEGRRVAGVVAVITARGCGGWFSGLWRLGTVAGEGA